MQSSVGGFSLYEKFCVWILSVCKVLCVDSLCVQIYVCELFLCVKFCMCFLSVCEVLCMDSLCVQSSVHGYSNAVSQESFFKFCMWILSQYVKFCMWIFSVCKVLYVDFLCM